MGTFIISGGTGYLGSALIEHLLDGGHEVVSLTRSPHPLFSSREKVKELSASEPLEQLLTSVSNLQLQGVIHCAAVASALECEKNPTLATEGNVTFSQKICALAQELTLPLTYVSTDLVFDGGAAPEGGFQESNQPAPISVYSQTKHEAELIIQQYHRSATVRISLLYGPSFGEKHGPMGWMLQHFRAQKPLVLFEDEWRTPIYVRDAARALKEITQKELQGLFHLGGPERMNRVEWGKYLANAGNFEQSLIQVKKRSEVPIIPPRPEDVSLNSSKLYSLLDKKPSSMEEVLSTLF